MEKKNNEQVAAGAPQVVEYRFKQPEQVSSKALRTNAAKIELRNEEEGTVTIVGYAAKFDSDSEMMYGFFVERIGRDAFAETDMSDVRALFNHDANIVLGRTTNGTLRLEIDEMGLRYEIDVDASNALIRDMVVKPIQRGDVSQSSFGFTMSKVSWDDAADPEIRTIERIDKLYDISPVTFPAYSETEASMRNVQGRSEKRTAQVEHQEQTEQQEQEDKGVEQRRALLAQIAQRETSMKLATIGRQH
jgi:HK97 family phage prohead protease